MDLRSDFAGRPVDRDRDVAWSIIAAPWGPIHIAASRSAVVALFLRSTDEAFLGSLARRGFDPRPSRDAPAESRTLLARVRALLERYAGGDAVALEHAARIEIDLGDRPDWDRAVLGAVRRIPSGSVSSYGGVARSIGRPGAARAVGGAVGRNPIALLVPCHRVIAGDGSIGGYGGSWFGTREENLDLKRLLLEHEGVRLPARLMDDGGD